MMTRILVAGGSEAQRANLCAALHADTSIETATIGPSLANVVISIKRLQPALVALIMDHAPANAIEAARRIMGEVPKPIVLVATQRVEAIASVLEHSGALAVLEFPASAGQHRRFAGSLKDMAEVKVVRRWRRENVIVRPAGSPPPRNAGQLVAIASSTGGPGALQQIFSELPRDFAAPILVVQHIAGGFAESLVRSFRGTGLTIKLAEDGEPLRPGMVYIAPDDRHLGVSSRNTVMLSAGPPIEGFRPSATHLFETAAKAFGPQLTAVVLTGMGRDGVAGLRAVHEAGGAIIAQDRETSAVFGMPKAAIENGFVDQVLPLGEIARELAQPEGVSA